MRVLGLLGGVTWHSTATYYRLLNEGVAAACGPFASSDLLIRSLDYRTVRQGRVDGDWRALSREVVRGCRALKRAGAEGLILGSNSLHATVPQVLAEVGLPVLHITDALAEEAHRQGHEVLAFFGTRFTMESAFLRERLQSHGLRALFPEDLGRIDHIILEELARGEVRPGSREVFLAALEPLLAQGATAMVHGCTEVGMLVTEAPVPILDTLALHAAAAVAWQVAPA